MTLLVFEFITGGGFAGQKLPSSLLREGQLMRKALLEDLSELDFIDLLVLNDMRVTQDVLPNNARIRYIEVQQKDDLQVNLTAYQDTYDSVWLIAPETDGILTFWCQFFTRQGKKLANCDNSALQICSNKLHTLQLLENANLPCVPGHLFQPDKIYNQYRTVLKVNDSVGCDEIYLLDSEQVWDTIIPTLSPDREYIEQPYIPGQALSLSALFYQGCGYFLCCNEQMIKIEDQQFSLTACTVNVPHEKTAQYQNLCQKIAMAIPGLFAYVGIDFIQTESGDDLILEINPRLTSSYAGIKQALGINIAALVMDMLKQRPPIIKHVLNRQVCVDVERGRCYVK